MDDRAPIRLGMLAVLLAASCGGRSLSMDAGPMRAAPAARSGPAAVAHPDLDWAVAAGRRRAVNRAVVARRDPAVPLGGRPRGKRWHVLDGRHVRIRRRGGYDGRPGGAVPARSRRAARPESGGVAGTTGGRGGSGGTGGFAGTAGAGESAARPDPAVRPAGRDRRHRGQRRHRGRGVSHLPGDAPADPAARHRLRRRSKPDLRQRLGDADAYPNTIVVVDPSTSSVVSTIQVGSNPGALALSDDGSTLWVGIDGARAFRKVTLTSTPPALGPLHHLPKSNPDGFFSVGSMVALPGAPLSVAIGDGGPTHTATTTASPRSACSMTACRARRA